MQHNYRDRRNRYLHNLGRLHQLADAMQMEIPVLVQYLDRLRALHQHKEALQAVMQQTATCENKS